MFHRLKYWWRELSSGPWPEKKYLFSPRHKFLYCPIQKVATTSIKSWYCLVEGLTTEDLGSRVHKFIGYNLLVPRDRRTLTRVLQDDEYFKFAFVRNPWERLVSAFLNKFVKLSASARDVLQRESGHPRWLRALRRVKKGSGGVADSFTFRKFVDFLSTEPPLRLDKHWLPQHLFLGGHSFDFIGRFEILADDFRFVCTRLGLATPLPHCNRCSFQRQDDAALCCADWPLAAIRERKSLPSWRRFYTPDLVEAVASLYREDIQRFGYSSAQDELACCVAGEKSSLMHFPSSSLNRFRTIRAPSVARANV